MQVDVIPLVGSNFGDDGSLPSGTKLRLSDTIPFLTHFIALLASMRKSFAAWVVAVAVVATVHAKAPGGGRYPRGSRAPYRRSSELRKRRRNENQYLDSDYYSDESYDLSASSSSNFLSELEDSLDEFLDDENDDIEQILNALERTEEPLPSPPRLTKSKTKSFKEKPKRRLKRKKRKRSTMPVANQQYFSEESEAASDGMETRRTSEQGDDAEADRS